ncbi:hypothetical protein DFH11DRAFT_1609311 [Phellopilus nigrolimitatus]|nr:hypothetical protein DFH11DRAFT_1609311 [Phellopilus nigrolimitatus]
MLNPRQHFAELSEYNKYVIQSSDVIEDLRIYVREESSEKVFWYKERFLTDDEIIENVVENATSKICWTIHRPKRGWYIRIRAPSFSPNASIPLIPVPASSPFHVEAALSFSSRSNPSEKRTLSPEAALSISSSAPPAESAKSSMETVTSSSETIVHSYPPTPSPNPPAALTQPPSPKTIRAKLDQLSSLQKMHSPMMPEVRQFLLAPHSSPHVPQSENTSLIARALSVFKNNKPSHSLSFTMCPLPSLATLRSSSVAQQAPPVHVKHSKHHSLARLGELIPSSPPPLAIFHDRTPAWNFGSTTGLLAIDTAMERELGVDRSFWVTVALAYMEFLTEREV